ncbi:MAG: hypothetical protein APF84_14745 [Gracilibacter sp. BRH_c7a]|nr:MAG: hypothetical protein APF84_14745 [Gracilibacter sp. BRH_c7a]
MRPKLLLVAPNENIAHSAREVAEEGEFNCRIVVGNLQNNGTKFAREAEKDGTEAIISRGGTFLFIKEMVENIPCIPISVSTLDLLQALKAVSHNYRKIGVMGFPNTIYEASSVGKFLDLKIVEIPLQDLVSLTHRIKELQAKGLEAIVGDTVSSFIASEIGVESVLINSGKRAIFHAMERAEELAYLRRKEAFVQQRVRAILDSVTEGIIALDNQHTIIDINPAVERYFGLKRHNLLGKLIKEALPEYQSVNDELLTIKNQKYLIVSQRIRHEGIEGGSILTLKPLKQIQDLEKKARKKLYARGLVAKHTFADIMGKSEPILKAVEWAKRISKSNSTVIIDGRTGTGKEMFAQSIHNASLRENEPFVAVNCASLPESLLESELFGYVEGSFTDARKGGKAGLFELAHQGTIFLDEIGDMSIAVQAKVLRVLQEKEVIRLGDNKVIPVDIRVIAATHVDLREAVKEGKFRVDLFYRVNVLKLTIPTLAERKEDICLLAEHFLQKFKIPLTFETEALLALLGYCWPGNIRELHNFIERLVVLSDGPMIGKRDVLALLPEEMVNTNEIRRSRRLTDNDLLEALRKTSGNQTHASEMLGINRSTLWRRLQKINE